MIRPLLRRAAPAVVCAAILYTLASPADVDAGGDAPDPCAAKLHWAGERVTFAGTAAPTELIISAAAGPEAVEVRVGRVILVHVDSRRTVPLRGVTDDTGVRQPRVIRLAAGETKRLHLAVRAPANRDAYLFEVEAVSGTCHYAAEVGVVREAPTGSSAPEGTATGAPQITSPLTCPRGMASIPGGTFVMGSDGLQAEERPAHAVGVSSFCMDITEVTVAAYEPCVRSGTCGGAGSNPSTWMDRRRYANYPMNCVDHGNAAAYCASVGKRLPTEEEWEYAARGGDEQREYPWGNAPTTDQLCYQSTDPRAIDQTPCPVGAFRGDVNRWGVLDLAGNVSEWTSSGWSRDYLSTRSVPTQSPGAPPGVMTGSYVVRGGNITSDASYPPGIAAHGTPRAAAREGMVHVTNSTYVGFRCVSSGVVAQGATPAR